MNISTDEIINRFKKLGIKQNLRLSNLDKYDYWILLASILINFSEKKIYSEIEINNQLKTWLNSIGKMVNIDFVELRRTLIDKESLSRNSDGSKYVLSQLSELCKFIMQELAKQDLIRLINSAIENRSNIAYQPKKQ